MFFNLTPHDVKIMRKDGTILVVPKSGIVARCEYSQQTVDVIDGVEIIRCHYGKVYNLPAPKDGVFYIVSLKVAQACPERTDLLIPGKINKSDSPFREDWSCRGLSYL